MVRGALLELAAGAGACCVALSRRRAGSARGALAAMLLLAALAVHAELLLSVANSTVPSNRAVVAYVEESTKLIRMRARASARLFYWLISGIFHGCLNIVVTCFFPRRC
jgi:hypothetical protein